MEPETPEDISQYTRVERYRPPNYLRIDEVIDAARKYRAAIRNYRRVGALHTGRLGAVSDRAVAKVRDELEAIEIEFKAMCSDIGTGVRTIPRI